MTLEILTKDDLNYFNQELILEVKALLSAQGPKKKWVKSSELRQLFNLSSSTLQTMRINGTIPYSNLGASLFYDLDAIEAILINNQKNTEL